jgi:hypothetical protein
MRGRRIGCKEPQVRHPAGAHHFPHLMRISFMRIMLNY